MNKLYSVHDHWTNINKKNDVDIESIDGVITGIKVNGEDYGGGGESDFSTATVTLIGEDVSGDVYLPIAQDAEEGNPSASFFRANYIRNKPQTYSAILYKNSGVGKLAETTHQIGNISGNAQDMGNGYFLVTGDCTITLKNS